MKLFKMNNNVLTISEEAYLLIPFKKIWERDKTKSKEYALAELAYIYFMEDFRSDYFDTVDDEERQKTILKNIDLPKKWKEDKVVSNARKYYREMSDTFSLKFLKDVMFALNKIREFFRNVDFTAVDSKGKPLYDIVKINNIIKQSDSTLENLSKLKKRALKDIEEEKKIRGSKEKSLFEDGI